MSQISTAVIILLLIILVFVPLAFLTETNQDVQEIKQTLNLCTRALLCSIDYSPVPIEQLSIGHNRDVRSVVKVNKEQLLEEFYALLYNNYYSQEKVEKIQSRILLKVLVCHDKFYIASQNDRWSTPYFFVEEHGDDILYFNTKNNQLYFYNDLGEMVFEPISAYGFSEEQKNDLIINTINRVVLQYTYEKETGKGFKIELNNPGKEDVEYRKKYGNFNVLNGMTFFVVYAQDTFIDVNRKDFEYHHYNVVGYTMEAY